MYCDELKIKRIEKRIVNNVKNNKKNKKQSSLFNTK